jgi:putative DNA primase/helicase
MPDSNRMIAAIIDAAPAYTAPRPSSSNGAYAQHLTVPPIADKYALAIAIEKCSKLDQSDTGNAKRFLTYFAGDVLVMQETATPGGSWLKFTGKFWDLANGAADVTLLAQQVGQLIAREADLLAATPHERRLIEAAEIAEKRRVVLGDTSFDDVPDEQKSERRMLEGAILAGNKARDAVVKRKIARRKFGITSQNGSRVREMLNMAAPHLRRDPASFNANPYVVATEDHTLHFARERDLECPDPDAERFIWRVQTRPGHDRNDLITGLVPVHYDPDAVALGWQQFLHRFMPTPTHAEKRRTLQQYCGVGLLGVSLQRVMYHYGLGANGKSVFLEVLTRVLGPGLAVSLPAETLVGKGDRSAGQAAPDIMRLFGKRTLRVSEVPADKPLQESLIKHITGGEDVTARTLFKGYVDFPNRTKPHMSGNGFPRIDGTDNGIWRRMMVMHWTETIPEGEQRNLEDVVSNLLTEAPGILNWLIEGALDYLNYGLYVAPAVSAATLAYRDEMDSIGQFIRDCVQAAPGETVTARTLYDAYHAWCDASAKHPVFQQKFGREMKKRFTRRDGAIHTYLDIRLHDVPLRSSGEPPAEGSDREFPG